MRFPCRTVLSSLSANDLVGLLVKLGLPKSGNKEERIFRVIDHFRSDADIMDAAAETAVVEMAPEPELLSDETLVDLLAELGVAQLADALQTLGLPKSGSKDAQIERLAEQPVQLGE